MWNAVQNAAGVFEITRLKINEKQSCNTDSRMTQLICFFHSRIVVSKCISSYIDRATNVMSENPHIKAKF